MTNLLRLIAPAVALAIPLAAVAQLATTDAVQPRDAPLKRASTKSAQEHQQMHGGKK